MYVLMPYQMAMLNECFITHFTTTRARSTVCSLIFYKSALISECLITYFTNIRTLNIVCVDGL